jgi:hypothetical protein
MQLREWRRWTRVVALVVLALSAIASPRVRADGSDEPPGDNERIVKIGPQAVVIVDDQGAARMYDDPSQDARACKSRGACWGHALNALSIFGLMTYLDLTEGVEGGGRAAQRIAPLE